MTKLRERIGALTLRSVLLLAALLALSQSASAWSNYRLVSSNFGQEFVTDWSQGKTSGKTTIDLTSSSDVTLWINAYNSDGSGNKNQLYTPDYNSTTTVSESKTFPSLSYRENFNNGITFTGGKKYTVEISATGGDPTAMTVTVDGSSQGGGDDPVGTGFTNGSTLYFKPFSDFGLHDKQPATMKATFSNNAEVFCSYVGDGYYSVVVPAAGLTTVKFTRGDKSNTSTSGTWWNTTATITYANGKNTIETVDSTWDNGTLKWADNNYEEPAPVGFIEGSTLYFKPGTRFGTQDNQPSSFKAHFSDDTEVFCVYEGDGYYSVTVPKAGLDWVYFIRGDKNNTGLSGTWYDNTTASIQYAEGKNTIEFNESADHKWTECSIIWADTNYSPAFAGMPFYPAGVYGEEEFAALDANERFYYLTGHSLNNGIPSPEWQMTKQADGNYTIDFTWNDHRYSGQCSNTGESAKISVQYYTPKMAMPSSLTTRNVNGIELFDQIPENRRFAGTRMRATYNPTANSLSFQYVTANGGTSTNIADAFYLPYISLVGDMSQKDGIPTTVGNYQKYVDNVLTTAYTTDKWQTSWIQYDEFGEPITSRDGTKVYTNTQWPPLHNVMFTGAYTDAAGVEHTVGINSGGLSFSRYGDIASGNAIKNMPEFAGMDTDKLDSNAEYYIYRATDFWGLGMFKIWSGWSNGYNSGNGAEWDNNWNWGQFDPNSPLNSSNQHDNNVYGSLGYYQIVAGSTVPLGNVNGNMGFHEPTYINQVYLFLNLNSPNSNDGKNFLYTRQAAGNARIEALANEENSAGAFNATVDAYANGETTPKVNGVRIRVVRANETDPDNNSVSIIREGNYAASGETLDWDPADFTQKLGELGVVTQATGNHYPSGSTYYHDGVNYPNSGWYEYVMDVKFEGLDVVTVRSNPFYVAKVENTLVAGQLVRVNKQNAVAPYNEYDYITYSMGANFAYGVKVAGGTNSEGAPVVAEVERLQSPANASYADPEKATWTKYVLFYARRPWKGDTPDHSLDGSVAKSWTVTYFNGTEEKTVTATTEDAPLQFIVPGADISVHDYKAALTYTPAGEGAQDVTVNMTNSMVLRIPTPRMKQNFFETHIGYQDEPYQDVTVAAEDHAGLVAAGDYTSEQTYTDTRVRHLSFRAQLEMPNADADLLALIPADENGHYFRQTRFSGDEKLRELLADQNVRIDLRNPNPTYITLEEQDLRNWLSVNEEGTGFDPIKRNLRFDFERNGRLITFFERFSEDGVTFSLDPKFYAPAFDATKAKLYRFKYKAGKGAVAGSDDDNWWKERIVLVTTPGIEPSTETSLAPDHTANVELAHSFYAFKMGDEIVGYDGKDGNTDTNALIHYNDLTTDSKTFFIQDSEPFHWYAEMDSHDIIKLDKLMINVAHGYIFHTERHAAFSSEEGLEPALSFGTAETPSNAPARAPYQAESKYMAFVGPFNVGVDAANAEIQTSVEAIGDYDAPAGVAGDGFIDMISRGAVYTIDGRCLFQGTGRVDLEPGIYVIATPKASYKVIVK